MQPRSIACFAFTLLAATASAQPLDAQQLLRMLQQGGVPTQPPPAAARLAAPSPSVSEQALAQQLAAWPAAAGPYAVARFRDGFSIDGQRVLDPEGRIVQFAVDSKTGDASYLVEMLPGQYVIKVMRQGAGAPVAIAQASRQAGTWSAETVSGVRVNGARLNLDARGFIVARENALFRYVAGAGLRSYGLPETHTLAAHQNGDVAATGWLLLEKRQEAKEQEGGVLAQGSVGGMISAAKSLGAIFGVAKSDSDFALYQLESGKTVPLAISLGDKQTSVLSQCRQRKSWLAVCDRADSIESLYGQDGQANRSHYYWRVSWYQTTGGPLALVMEDSIGKIDALDLATGRRANVFQRALGIGDWSTAQMPDGRVQVKAQLGFETAVNEDVARLFDGVAVQTSSSR